MNGSLINDLLGHLQGDAVGQIATQLGADTQTTQSAIAAALPMIVGALGHNTQQPGGAEALFGALQRDHVETSSSKMDVDGLLGSLLGGSSENAGAMGGLGDMLSSILGGGAPVSRQLDGSGILGHIFGAARPRAESSLGQATGLSGSQAGQLLKILAPIVMGFLGRQVSARQIDAGGLGSMLGQEHAQLRQQGSLASGLINAVLDTDGDGDVDLSDLMRLGSKFLR